jgi:hypothetical protein
MEVRVTNGGSYINKESTYFSLEQAKCPGLPCQGYYGSWTSYAYCDGGAYSYSEDDRYRYLCSYASYVESNAAGDACGAAGVACVGSHPNAQAIMATCGCPTVYYVLHWVFDWYTTVRWYQVPTYLDTWTWGC